MNSQEEIEEKIVNPLNNILMLTNGKRVFKPIEREINKIIKELEKSGLIRPRKSSIDKKYVAED